MITLKVKQLKLIILDTAFRLRQNILDKSGCASLTFLKKKKILMRNVKIFTNKSKMVSQ